MKILLSPAKSFHKNIQKEFSPQLTKEMKLPHFTDESKVLIKLLKEMTKEELKSLMKISDKVAELNMTRYKEWHSSQEKKSDPCLFFFNGDVYKGLSAENLSEEQILFLQNHLLILSGLYGVLRPLDLISAYRLEMGTALVNDQGKNLYLFWQKKLQQYFEQLEDQTIINLASNEYFKVLNFKNNLTVYNIVFQDYHKGVYKTIGILAKKARGVMTSYIAKNQLEKIEDIKFFQEDGYQFNQTDSNKTNLIFQKK